MLRFRIFTGVAIMGVAFLVSTGASQDAKKDTTPVKSYSPPGWKALGLSKEQSLDISKIHQTFKAKVKALEEQIKETKTKERQEMIKILTEDQKDKLRKLVVPEEKKADTPAKSAK